MKLKKFDLKLIYNIIIYLCEEICPIEVKIPAFDFAVRGFQHEYLQHLNHWNSIEILTFELELFESEKLNWICMEIDIIHELDKIVVYETTVLFIKIKT